MNVFILHELFRIRQSHSTYVRMRSAAALCVYCTASSEMFDLLIVEGVRRPALAAAATDVMCAAVGGGGHVIMMCFRCVLMYGVCVYWLCYGWLGERVQQIYFSCQCVM